MAITPPSNVSYGTVVWRAVIDVVDGVDVDDLPDYVVPTGTVTFTPSVSKVLDVAASPDPLTIVRSPIVAVLDDAGYLCTPDEFGAAGARGVKLIATDDADLNPTGWTYNVTYNLRRSGTALSGLTGHSLTVPAGAVRDLTTAIPADAADAIGIPQAEALAAQAVAAASDASLAALAAQASAEAAEGAVIDSASFVGQMKVWAKNPDQLIAGALTYSSGLLSTAVVEWPDGKPGVMTITSRQATTGAVTGYTVTHVDGGTTKTYTQPTITRDSSGAATIVPQITVV